MRRILALIAAFVVAASLTAASVSAAPAGRTNNFYGAFAILDWDHSPVGYLVTQYREPTDRHVVPGTFDITWVPGARFPFEQQPYTVDESHAQLVAAWFGPGTPAPGGKPFTETGISGYICDYSAPWNANCHDFSVAIQKDVDAHGTDMIGFAGPRDSSGVYDYNQWYIVGRGVFALTYVGPTGA